ncbi:MAG TPA: YafY family protein [Acidimicrobiales bacterium]|nr:YafY family protein [Acidimicrobiales bacterium]
MRADRLVAIVLLLQVHGRLTATDLAERLETSERTIRRDLDALCAAGVPVYAQRGRNGGWELLGGHRVDLSGLTTDEARALFLATAPGATGELGQEVGQGLAAVRRKLLAALPEPLRAHATAAGSAILVDSSRWGPTPPTRDHGAGADGAHLEALRRAVCDGRQVVLRYEPPGRPAEDRRLHPYGLVCKRGVWYLLAGGPTGLRTYRLSRVRAVTVTDETAERPAGFDLARVWADVQLGLSRRTPTPVATEVAVTPAGRRRLEVIGAWWPIDEVGTGGDGREVVVIRFPTPELAAAELATLGEDVEVLSPAAVRNELARIGRRLLARYAAAEPVAEQPPP